MKNAIDLILEQDVIDSDFLDSISLSSPTKEELDKMFDNPIILEKTAEMILLSGRLEEDCENEPARLNNRNSKAR